MILFKKQLFDLGVKVPRRSLWYATYHLMVMHPHTKYHWPISKDKNVMAWTRKYYLKNNYLTLRSKVKVPRRSLRYATHPPYGHAPTYQISLTYLERQKCYGLDKKILFKKQLFDLEVKGQGPTKVITLRDTSALWSCTHIPNIIDLSGKTKMLWSGQTSLRRSRRGRKNQTKTMSPFVQRGDIIIKL